MIIHNKTYEQLLFQIGLSENEAKLYLALLPQGKMKIGELAVRAKTNRTNTYQFLKSLEEKGLVEFDKTKGARIVLANDPSRLTFLAEQKQKQYARLKYKVQDVLPELGAVYNQQRQKPKIRYYFGKEHYLRIQDETLAEKEVLIFVSMADFYRIIPWEEDELYFHKRVKQGTLAYIIGPDDEFIRKQAQEAKRFMREVRVLPKGFKHQFHGTSIVFGNTVIFYTFTEDLMTVVIESKDIVEILRAAFWMSWEQSIPIS